MWKDLNMEFNKSNKTNQPCSNNSFKGKICPYCGQSSQTVFVHGHEQCVVCKTNVEPCCSGKVSESGKDLKWIHPIFRNMVVFGVPHKRSYT